MAEETLKLFLRLRDQQSEGIICLDSRSLCLQKNTESRQYQLTGIMQPLDDQDKVYETVGKRGVQKFLEGYSSMFFLYGANDTGKTYTILGDQSHLNDVVEIGGAGYKERGLVVRAMEQIFRKAKVQQKQKEFHVSCSCIQISKVKISDLSLSNNKNRLRIEENSDGWFTAINLHHHPIKNMSELVSYLKQILQQRQFSNTHLIFEINLLQIDTLNKTQEPIQSYITFVELGFIMHTEEPEEQQQMLIQLNSLSNILNKINNLESVESNFKQSRLTRILKQSICNSENITIIGTVGYSNTYLDNLETLNFLKTARDIEVATQRTLSNKKRRSKRIVRRQSGASQKDEILSYTSTNTLRRKQSYLQLTNHNVYDRTQYLLSEKAQNDEIIKDLQLQLEELKLNNTEVQKKHRIKKEQLNHNISSLKYTASQLKINQQSTIKGVLLKYEKSLEEQSIQTPPNVQIKENLNRLPSEAAMMENIKDEHRRAMKGVFDSRDQIVKELKKNHNKQMSTPMAIKIDPFNQAMYSQSLSEIHKLNQMIKKQETYIKNMEQCNIDRYKLMQILNKHNYKLLKDDGKRDNLLKEAKGITMSAKMFKDKIDDYLKAQIFIVNYKERIKNGKAGL